MVTSTFFNNFQQTGEQELLHSLIVESIKIYGQDMYYLPRRENNFDGIYGDDDVPSFDTAYLVEFYIKSVEGFGGQGSFMSKFGIEIRDQVTLSIAKRTFETDISTQEPALIRPREGDLIYFPLNKKAFQIMYVDKFKMFYTLGDIYMYDMQCELYEYSNESFSTGIAEIDDLEQNYSYNAHDFAILTESGYIIKTEANTYIMSEEYNSVIPDYDPLADNTRIEEESDRDGANTLINWSEQNPFGGDEEGKF
jgi:Virus neck protein